MRHSNFRGITLLLILSMIHTILSHSQERTRLRSPTIGRKRKTTIHPTSGKRVTLRRLPKDQPIRRRRRALEEDSIGASEPDPGEGYRKTLADLDNELQGDQQDHSQSGEQAEPTENDEDSQQEQDENGSISIELGSQINAKGNKSDAIEIDGDSIMNSNQIEEEEDIGNGTKLEDKIIGMQLGKMERNLTVYKDRIIKCIDQRYSTNMFMEQLLVKKACLGAEYQILMRLYHENIDKTQRIFMKIFRHKLTMFKEEFREDVLIFCNIIRMMVLKDLNLSESLEVAQEKIGYMMLPSLYKRILIELCDEITAYDEMRTTLIDIKNHIHEHLARREEEKEEAKKKLLEEEGIMDEEELGEEGEASHSISIEDGIRGPGNWEDNVNEDHTNLEDLEDSEGEEDNYTGEEDETSRVEPDNRDEYDPSAASVGPGPPSEESSMDSSMKRDEVNGSESAISVEHKVDRPILKYKKH